MNINRTLASTLLVSLSLLPGAVFAEDVSGVMEKGPAHTALFTYSLETGDPIGFVVQNTSPVARKLAQACLPGLACEIRGVRTRPYSGRDLTEFEDSPSGWYEIVSFKEGNVAGVHLDSERAARTRFGTVEVDEKSGRLHFKGKPINPPIEENSGLSIINSYPVGDADVLLLQNLGGSGCPVQYRFVSVRARGVSATQEFGTCSDLMYPTYDGKKRITVSMVGFVGPFEPVSAQRAAARSKHVFVFDAEQGTLLEDGKPLK